MDVLRALCTVRGFARSLSVPVLIRATSPIRVPDHHVLCIDLVCERCPVGMLMALRLKRLRENVSRETHAPL